MPSRSRSLAGFLLVLSVLTSACNRGFVKSMADVTRLQQAIVKKFGEQGVNVRLNNSKFLVITFINSPLNDGSAEERAKRAQETALFVKEQYQPVSALQQMMVAFIRQHTQYFVITQSEMVDLFPFDKNAQAMTEHDRLNDFEETQPIVSYHPTRKQTDVSTTPLQLSGIGPGNGMTLAPNFAVPGDATKTKSKALPAFVAFDFASYSREDVFGGKTVVKFLLDAKLAFQLTGDFTGARSQDGIYSKFLYGRLSYKQFQELTDSKQVRIVIETEQYSLTADQLSALRAMRKYVEE